MSDFTITIQGRDGVVLDAVIDETLRFVRRLAVDDERLKELLVITSVCAGVVEGELMKLQAKTDAAQRVPTHAPTCAVNEEGRHECCE
ncbi:MAG: hypothetical protein KCHDKBKB_03025 [Elusimicrobia bacterium]|nr:hypothetical protein [Elusimicrobiota bacterium]